MALKKMSLSTIAETATGRLFDDHLKEVIKSLEKDVDINVARSINLKITLKPDGGYLRTCAEVSVKTPNRSISSMAKNEDGAIKIDTFSEDVQQGDLLEKLDTKETEDSTSIIGSGEAKQ